MILYEILGTRIELDDGAFDLLAYEAERVLLSGLPPSEYARLDEVERDAFVAAGIKLRKQQALDIAIGSSSVEGQLSLLEALDPDSAISQRQMIAVGQAMDRAERRLRA